MYRNLALANGILLAVMVFYNNMLSGITGPYLSTLIFHLLGLVLILALSLARKNKLPRITKISPIYFLPGILSLTTILLNNLCIPRLGVSLTVGVGLYGQLVMSSLVEHFGLFGMSLRKFRKWKLAGFSIISLGITAMISL
ncbi:MAG: DMT family transporter [Pseudomonadota bacterium]